ncbi:MAG: hypothetical protein ABI972_13730 [Acidobacteriota bacterium]
MARLFAVRNNTKEPTDVIYSVEQAVGIGSPNLREDVLLVQFLLRILREPGGGGRPFIPPGETAPLAIDGVFGKHTAAHIKFFQEEDTRRNPDSGLVLDQRVDPVKKGRVTGAITGKLLTITSLNIQFAQRKGKSIHNNINQDPLFPQELTSAFFL